MRAIVLFVVALIALTGQTPQPPPAPGSVMHLVYQYGYNTNANQWGPGTGTTTIDMVPASDGGVILYGTDWIWNTNRARQTNVCELYPDGKIDCKQPPNAISPVQLTLFPLLAQAFFSGLNASGTGTWKVHYTVRAAIAPAASANPNLSQPYTWTFDYTYTGKGHVENKGGVLIEGNGKFERSGGYFRGKGTQRIAYDATHKFPLALNDTRTHLPQTSVYSNDVVEVRLLKAKRP